MLVDYKEIIKIKDLYKAVAKEDLVSNENKCVYRTKRFLS